jgi:hypothetical protein
MGEQRFDAAWPEFKLLDLAAGSAAFEHRLCLLAEGVRFPAWNAWSMI